MLTSDWCRGFAAGLWCRAKVVSRDHADAYIAGFEEGLRRRDARERAR